MTTTGSLKARYAHVRGRFAGRVGMVVPFLVLLPVLTGYGAMQSLLGVSSGATLQKLMVLICTIIAAVLVGLRIPPWPILVIFGVIVVALSLGLLFDSGVDKSVLIRGSAGYTYAWFAFFVDWRKINERARALALALAPTAALLISLPLALSGHTIFVMQEYTGASRLAAGMPPAYLASLALFGVVGAAWFWALGNPWGLWIAVLNAGICALTGTRGATLAAGLVFVGMLVVAVVRRQPHWRIGLGVGALGLIAGVVLFLPLFVQRSTSSAHGVFGFSGRTEAWSYFLGKFEERPWIGFGPGGATVLAEESGNETIIRSFVSPHSAYVSLLVDIGVPLTVVFIAMLGALFWFAYRNVTSPYRPMIWVTLATCVFYGAFDNLLNAAQSAVPLALFLAMAAAGTAPALRAEENRIEDSLPSRRAWRASQRETH